MRHLLPLSLLLLGSPVYADAMPDGTTPDHGRHRPVTSETPAWRPDGTRVTGPGIIGRLRPGAPIATGGGPAKIDGEGTRYTPQSRRLGFLPVPLYVAGATNYQRSGGGLVRVIETPGPQVSRVGPIAAAIASMPNGGGGGQPPGQPPGEPPSQPPGEPPGRPPGVQVPGPVPFLGLGAAWMWSRRLRRRIHRKVFVQSANPYTPYQP